jgi:hypothetical protein
MGLAENLDGAKSPAEKLFKGAAALQEKEKPRPEVKPEAKAAPIVKKTSKLKAVSPKMIEPSRPKILIYGMPEAGKTYGALGFPATYYFDCEGGAVRDQYKQRLIKSGGVYFGEEQGSKDFATVVNEIKLLATEDHSYKTLVVDSISKLYGTIIATEEARLGDKDAFGASKKPAVALTRQLISWIDKVDMNVILIAHEKALWGKDNKGNPAQIGTTFDAWDKLAYELDLCFQVIKTGESRKAFVRKSRLTEFPSGESFDWSYEEFANRYGKSIMEAQVKPVVLATPEQLTEIKRLLGIVKLSDTDKLDKWITDNLDNFDELEEKNIEKILNHLKGKIDEVSTKN